MSSLIKRMAHVGLEVPDLDASVSWATTVMGTREVQRTDGVSYLTHAVCHHSLELHAAHGAGQNLFTYHFDPAGCVVEYYGDLYQVWDQRTCVPGKWSLNDPRGQNPWGPQTPPDLLRALTPLAKQTREPVV